MKTDQPVAVSREDRLSPAEIKAIRARHDLTQQGLAERTGIGIASIKRWEAGALQPSASMDRLLRQIDNVRPQDDGFLYVEWVGEPCPFCGQPGVSGKSPTGQFFAGCPDGDCIAHNLAYDFVTVDHARAAWNTRLATRDGAVELSEDALTALGWLGTHRNLELSFYRPTYGDDDDLAEEWRVHRIGGGINDREWTLVGSGASPLAALQAARALLAEPAEGEGK